MGAGGGSNSRLGIRFPRNPGQVKHIFRKSKGHLENDTFANRRMLLNVANNKRNYLGKDVYGVDWYGKNNSNGTQVWVRAKDGIIRDAGVNQTPKTWEQMIGYSHSLKKE